MTAATRMPPSEVLERPPPSPLDPELIAPPRPAPPLEGLGEGVGVGVAVLAGSDEAPAGEGKAEEELLGGLPKDGEDVGVRELEGDMDVE